MLRRVGSREAYAGWLTMYYHRIEKGLSFDNPRLGFGEEVVCITINSLNHYISVYGTDRSAILCWKTLNDYFVFHRNNNKLNEGLYKLFSKININETQVSDLEVNATINCDCKEILGDSTIDFHRFVNSRHSVRDFSEQTVDIEQIKKAAKCAQRTPSVCNRQAWRLHVYQEPAMVNNVLSAKE